MHIRILVCKNEKNRRISLYSIFIDPSNVNYFAVSGRDQWARYLIRNVGSIVLFSLINSV